MTRSRGRGKRVVGGDRGEGGLVGEVGGAEKEMLSSLVFSYTFFKVVQVDLANYKS